jgi:hypothetical protein
MMVEWIENLSKKKILRKNIVWSGGEYSTVQKYKGAPQIPKTKKTANVKNEASNKQTKGQ